MRSPFDYFSQNHKVVPLQGSISSASTAERKDLPPEPETPPLNDGITKNRTCTDVIFIILLAAFIIVWIVLISYCMINGDINRIINGYDDCANICGQKNIPDSSLGCTGADRTNYKYLQIEFTGDPVVNPSGVHRMCVADCNAEAGYKKFLNRCMPKSINRVSNSFFSKTGVTNFFQEVSEDLELCWREIIYLCLIALLFSIVILLLFRFITGFIVWIVLIGAIVVSFCGTIFLWVTWKQESDRDKSQGVVENDRTKSYFIYAILATIFTILICLVILVLRKRIKLVIQLFREAGKAIASMPLLLLQPILTFITLGLIAAIWLYFAIIIESSGFLRVENNTSAKYIKDSTIKLTRWYNLFALFWYTQFLIGCQHMVVAGAVGAWFFTRNKSNLKHPVATAFGNLCRYHLGTVAFGALLIAVIQLIRALFRALEYSLRDANNPVTKFLFRCCQCCLGCVESIVSQITRNAYIETAINALSFCAAGRLAFKILVNNALRVAAINSVGDFVLFLGKVVVVAATVLIGMELIQAKQGLRHTWVPLTIAGLFAYAIANCFITIYEMTIDTIFICFCEDCEQNDGINRPYYMSRGLMEFVQNSKKVLEIHDERSGKAWSDKGNRSAKAE